MLLHLGLPRAGRVGIYLEKRFETVIASFGAPAAGGVSLVTANTREFERAPSLRIENWSIARTTGFGWLPA